MVKYWVILEILDTETCRLGHTDRLTSLLLIHKVAPPDISTSFSLLFCASLTESKSGVNSPFFRYVHGCSECKTCEVHNNV